MVGQTHSVMTHKRFYVKQHLDKKRKYEEGKHIQDIFNINMIQHPLPPFEDKFLSTEETKTADVEITIEASTTLLYSTLTLAPIGSEAVPEDAEFGLAREDLYKKGFRFEWTKNEIAHLQYYILNIEPKLFENEKRNKYSSCLNYLREADSLIQQDFHPFHCVNSSRIKTGYEVAIKGLSIESKL